MLRTSVLVSLLSAITLVPISARALVFAGDLPFPYVEDIEIVDDLAYVVSRNFPGSGMPTLRILDLSDPSTPVVIGSLDTPVGAQDVEVVGGLAYITDKVRAGSLRIIDVSNPAVPVEIGSFASEFEPIDVEVVGNFAYLTDQIFIPYGCYPGSPCGSIFRVIDVSDPTAPVQVSETSSVRTGDMEAAEGVVYIVRLSLSQPRLEVVDVSDPNTPVTVGWLPGVVADDIALSEGHVYASSEWGQVDPVTGERYGLEVINVMDPANPFRVGRAASWGSSIGVVGGLAFTAGPGLNVVDVSNPAALTRRGSIFSDLARDVAVYGGYAYLANLEQIRVVDLSVLDTPVEVGSAEIGDWNTANDVAVSDGVAYLAIGDERSERGLRIFDVTDPTAPSHVGEIDTIGVALDVELEGKLAYVAVDSYGLRIFDVSTPSAPVAVGGIVLPGSAAKLAVIGEIAYVADRGFSYREPGALRLVDVSDPASPTELGAVELMYRCMGSGIAVVEEIAYMTCNGLYVFDVSDPAQPTLIFSESMNSTFLDIHVAGGLAYMVSDTRFLRVFDVSNPTLPVEVSETRVGGKAIVVENGLAYSAGSWGLSVQDVVDPLQPVLMGGFPSDIWRWRDLAISDGLIFAAAGREGLRIIDLGSEYAPALFIEIDIRPGSDSNPIHPSGQGNLPVAILGSDTFDVMDVDVTTLALGPDAAAPSHDLTKPGLFEDHLRDVNDDGSTDLITHYRIQEAGIEADAAEACITGETLDGIPFEGCDSIRAVATKRRMRR